MTWRIKLLQATFIIWTGILSSRLIYWQTVKAEELKHQAQLQYEATITIPAARGEIKSSDGFPLVANEETYLLYASPPDMSLDNQSLSRLAEILPASDSVKLNLQELTASTSYWIPLAKNLPLQTRQAIEQLRMSGLGFEPEPKRVYPEGSSSAYLTGFVGKNSAGTPLGYFGLEGFYNRLLTGIPGRLIQQFDAVNRPIVIGGYIRLPPQPGKTLITSIDRTIQFVAANKLEQALSKYQASAGTVSVMDSQTGHILAMVSLPGYDPQSYFQSDPDIFKNPIISEGYEPGSTFKTIVMASALDADAVTPQTKCTICTGPVILSGLPVRSYNDKYYPESNMTEVILHSDNVGMVFVAQRLGKKRLLDYFRRFGLGQLTGIDLQEEDTPVLRPDDQWREVDWGTAAFGQGIAVTRLQLLTAVNVLATGGLLYPPRIVTHFESDSPLKDLPSPKASRIISSGSAAQITQMMVNGVENGEVRYYKPAGFFIAGKTGTAQVPIAGHYDPDKTIASFLGFAPAENPKFTMLVTLTDPQTSPWGSTTAAPLWFDIARDLFRYYRIAPRD
ncbi:hypothetical protein A3H89_04010 [Candidatus Amesbacteria bacterium RIFCSPLOWO2_02_FULL_48_11]|nr:MAG: hypothetical protein A2V48_04830 [Candidatus Amesbacteria bacterium RBG_19FT_COMBO_48_16]OGC96370.1 MAG: hypothetical protein A3C34_01280 [Candidatus Amesbacteria bacterium RIFCSPHIGHO2_02_FULL_48_21]OGC98603.1 MAG: hypothetical protein A2W16_03745 [Candidatus Amesbacteria bacterium RBG_16_48_31]OGC99449.1 MAG: hypothetical protein A2702_03425 [Candidatus Amesbacteria bacterium RIFCSPHIGHO2_01_FULL_48_75]OGD07998.1 MAG: hypothetical protein A3H89_04010 [Candidatus Amesbacteria bacterium